MSGMASKEGRMAVVMKARGKGYLQLAYISFSENPFSVADSMHVTAGSLSSAQFSRP